MNNVFTIATTEERVYIVVFKSLLNMSEEKPLKEDQRKTVVEIRNCHFLARSTSHSSNY